MEILKGREAAGLGADELRAMVAQLNVSFFVLGFPKCGTTSFADWLSGSDELVVSSPKETFLFCPQFGRNVVTDAQAVFSEESDARRVEASTLNVYSADLPDALAPLSDVKCVVMIRRPEEAVVSWHNQMLNANLVDEADLQVMLQGKQSFEPDHTYLTNYRDMCSYGKHLQRWLDALGHDRLLVLHLDDIEALSPEIRERVQRFFGVADLPVAMPVLNKFNKVRFSGAYSFLRRPSVKRNIDALAVAFPILRRLKVWIRENVFLRKAEKQPATALSELWQEDYRLALDILAQNKQHWTRR